MAVEVKTKLVTTDVQDHIRRLEKLRKYAAGQEWENKKLLGGIAGAVVDGNVREYALNQGLFLISQSGESLKVESPLGSIREW
jgi:hypothetical protein